MSGPALPARGMLTRGAPDLPSPLGFLGIRPRAMSARRATKQVYTTSQVARLCHVTAGTVANWIDAGRLPAFRTPGGHRRVRRDDLVRFMEEACMTTSNGDAGSRCRVLVVDDDPATVAVIETLITAPHPPLDVRVARDGFEAGRLSAEFRPDIVLLSASMPGVDGRRVCRRLKADPLHGATTVVMLTRSGDGVGNDALLDAGAAECLEKPLETAELRALFLRLVPEEAVR